MPLFPITGKQSAALVVKGSHNIWYDDIDLRVDDSKDPFGDLTRLTQYHYGRTPRPLICIICWERPYNPKTNPPTRKPQSKKPSAWTPPTPKPPSS